MVAWVEATRRRTKDAIWVFPPLQKARERGATIEKTPSQNTHTSHTQIPISTWTMATTIEQQQQQASGQIIQQYRELVKDGQQLAQKISELETDRNEHKLVEETLTPLDPSRKAYRLVGEVLVERTVQEVLPSVISNRSNVSRLSD
jgi:prefoldin subunit 2